MKFCTALAFVYLFFIHGTYAQDALPVIQTSHQQDIRFYDTDFSNDLLMTADSKEVILWNRQSGKQLRRIALPYTIRGAALCSNGDEVAVIVYEYGKDASLRFFDSRTGAAKDSVRFADTRFNSVSYKSLDGLVADKTNDRVAVKYFNEVRVVDVHTRKITGTLRLPSYDAKFSFTADANHLFVTYSNDGQLRAALVDIDGTVIKENGLPGAKPAALAASASYKDFFVLNDKAGLYVVDPALTVTDSIKTDSVHSVTSYSPPNISVNRGGDRVLVFLGSANIVYDRISRTWKGGDWNIRYADLMFFADKDATAIVKVAGKSAGIIDAASGKELQRLEGKNVAMENVSFSPSGKFLAKSRSGSFSNFSDVLDLGTGMAVNNLQLDYAIFQWLTDSTVLSTIPFGWDEKTGKETRGIQVKNIFSGKVYNNIVQPGMEGHIEKAIISPDGKTIAYIDAVYRKLYIASGEKFSKKNSFSIPGQILRTILFTPDSKKVIVGGSMIRVYDLEKGKWTLFGDSAKTYGYSDITVTPDSRYVWFESFDANTKSTIYAYDLSGNKLSVRKSFDSLVSEIRCHPTADLYATGFFNGSVELRRISDDALLYSGKDHNGIVQDFVFAPANHWLASLGDDQLLKISDYSKNASLVTVTFLYREGERGFALITPDNYYIVPPALINELHFSKDFQVYSFAQMDLYLNRPDKVLDRLGRADRQLLDMYKKAFRRRLNKAGFTDETPPDFSAMKTLRVLNTKIPSAPDPILPLQVQTAQDAATIRKLNVYVNGQKVTEIAGHQNSWTVPVQLGYGINNIELAYTSVKGMESYRERIEVNYQPAVPVKATTYYIGIGVSSYQDPAMNLKYAIKDVTDIASRFSKRDSATRVYLFTDSMVTRKMIDSVQRILSAVNIDDEVVISFSGHGLLDTAYNFYFASWDMDFSNPAATGIGYNDIAGLLNIPARKKLLLIDACHSGEVDKEFVSIGNASRDTATVKGYARSSIKIKRSGKLQNTVKLMEQYFTDVNKDNGANIISAAAGEEYALESGEWNNGVFSYSLMKGLFDKEADINHDGKITQSEIRRYMQQSVQKLTGGRQQPTSRSFNTDYDWVL